MEAQYCSICGKGLQDQDPAYGLTDGRIDQEYDGFSIDFDSEWTLYCPECMNEVDRLVAEYVRGKNGT